MKHLLKKKSLFVLLLIVSVLVIFSGCSSLQSDESTLVGHWESELKDPDDGTPLFSMTFNKDGTGMFDFFVDYSITDYACEDGTLHMDLKYDSASTTINFKYRFNKDKSAVYIYDDEYPDEYKFNRSEHSQTKDDTPTDSNSEINDSDDNSDSSSKNDKNSSTNGLTSDEPEYTPFGVDNDILGYWENSDGDVGNNYYYAVWFNDDGTGYLSLDEDYNIVSFCCVDGYIIAYLDDDSSVEIPYRYNKDKSSLYLTLSNGEMRFDKGELGIG